MKFTIDQANTVNTLLRVVIGPRNEYDAQDRPTEEDGAKAAGKLAGWAHKALSAGYSADEAERYWQYRKTHISSFDAETITSLLTLAVIAEGEALRADPDATYGIAWKERIRGERLRLYDRSEELAHRLGAAAVERGFKLLATSLRDQITLENVPEPLDIAATVQQAKEQARERAQQLQGEKGTQ